MGWSPADHHAGGAHWQAGNKERQNRQEQHTNSKDSFSTILSKFFAFSWKIFVISNSWELLAQHSQNHTSNPTPTQEIPSENLMLSHIVWPQGFESEGGSKTPQPMAYTLHACKKTAWVKPRFAAGWNGSQIRWNRWCSGFWLPRSWEGYSESKNISCEQRTLMFLSQEK